MTLYVEILNENENVKKVTIIITISMACFVNSPYESLSFCSSIQTGEIIITRGHSELGKRPRML